MCLFFDIFVLDNFFWCSDLFSAFEVFTVNLAAIFLKLFKINWKSKLSFCQIKLNREEFVLVIPLLMKNNECFLGHLRQIKNNLIISYSHFNHPLGFNFLRRTLRHFLTTKRWKFSKMPETWFILNCVTRLFRIFTRFTAETMSLDSDSVCWDGYKLFRCFMAAGKTFCSYEHEYFYYIPHQPFCVHTTHFWP